MASAFALRSARLAHLYLGVFIAPALLFFAFTGALQTFSLHETTRGSTYVPPAWAVVLGQIHKKQTSVVPARRPSPPEAKSTSALAPSAPLTAPKPDSPAVAPRGAAQAARDPLPLKIFFLLVSIGLFISTATGIYMAFRYGRSPLVVTALLVTGTLIPVALLFV